jgi:hypothetical protein
VLRAGRGTCGRHDREREHAEERSNVMDQQNRPLVRKGRMMPQERRNR